MIQKVLERDDFQWLDVVSPTSDELSQIASTYNLPPTAVQDCLEPEHLPKIERFENCTFIIVRAFGDRAFEDPEADTVQELTRKIAIFFAPKVFITIHRKDLGFLNALREK